MKKYLLIVCLVVSANSYSQAYYPNLDNLFLTNKEEESFFSGDLLYFKTFLKESTKRIFYADLQFSMSTNGRATFHSLGLIPRGNKSNPFLNTGINLIFDPKLPAKMPRIDIIVNQIIQEVDSAKTLNGRFEAYNEGLILEFPQKMITPLDSNKKNNINHEKRSRLMVTNIDYELSKSKFTATLKGEFDSFIKLTQTNTVPKTIHSVTIELTKNRMKIQIHFIDKKDKNRTFVIFKRSLIL